MIVIPLNTRYNCIYLVTLLFYFVTYLLALNILIFIHIYLNFYFYLYLYQLSVYSYT